MKVLKPVMWTLDQALQVVRQLQPRCHAIKYHVALGGGVLNRGESHNDLDLFFLPFGDTDEPPDHAAVRELTQELGTEYPLGGGPKRAGAPEYPNQERTFKSRYTYWTYDNKRIDVFIAHGV